jgi:hypothetical protein
VMPAVPLAAPALSRLGGDFKRWRSLLSFLLSKFLQMCFTSIFLSSYSRRWAKSVDYLIPLSRLFVRKKRHQDWGFSIGFC